MATLEEIGQALKNADAAGDVAAARRLAEAYDSMRKSTSVNEPTSAQSAIAAGQDLVPQPVSNQRYNPNQSTLGYVGNQVSKSIMGILGIPESAIRGSADQPSPVMLPALISKTILDMPGAWNANKTSRVLGIDPNMKAPGPGTEALTDLGIEVGQNFLFPGGSKAAKVASGIGSYLGRTMGEEVGGPAGGIIGSVAGGVSAPALISARIGAIGDLLKAARGDKGFLEKVGSNPEVMRKVRQDVLNELSDSLRKDPDVYAAKYMQAQELESAIPGLKLNLGQSFMAPSVLQKQRALDASGPSEMNVAQARRNANESVLRGALGEQPGARGIAEMSINNVSGDIAARSRSLSDEIAKTADEANALAARFKPADLSAMGQKALDIRTSALGAARQKANTLMDLASEAAQTEGARFDTTSLIAKAKQIQSEPIWDDANTTAIFGKVKSLGGQEGAFDWNPIEGARPKNVSTEIGFDDIKEMRQAVNADIASALRSNSPNARAQLRNLNQLKDEIDSVITNSPFEATKKAYRGFVDFYRTEFAPRFLRGVNILPEKSTALGETRLPPEQVFNKYLKPNGGLEMGRYLKLYGDNTDAMTMMRDAITDRYAKEVVRDGGINPAAHARFMERYKVPLATLDKAGFKFGQELQDTSRSFQAVSDRLASLQDAAARADKDLVRGLIADQFGPKLPEQVVSEILPDPRKTMALLSRMNKDQARGLVEFIKDDLVRQFSKDGQISPDAIDAFLGDKMRAMSYKAALSKVYGAQAADSQLDTLRKISEAAKRLDATPVPQSSAVQGKPSLFRDELQKQTGLSIAVVGNMTRAVLAGRVSAEWAALALGSQAGATVLQNMRNKIYAEVLKDPESAKMLLQMMRTPPASGAGVEAFTRFLKKTPSALNFLLGLDKYPEFAKYAAANFAREESEKQLQNPTEAQQ